MAAECPSSWRESPPNTQELRMRSKGSSTRCSLGVVLMCLIAVDASATAVAVADVRLDWNSVVISHPGLTVLPDPAEGGAYANTAYLGVYQAGYGTVTVPSDDLSPYNLAFQPVDVSNSVIYNAVDSRPPPARSAARGRIAASSRARATKALAPIALMNCSAPPWKGAKPQPKMSRCCRRPPSAAPLRPGSAPPRWPGRTSGGRSVHAAGCSAATGNSFVSPGHSCLPSSAQS
jgi:hypothetical protein